MNIVKGKDIVGLKIITREGGRELDRVEDIVYDPKENRVKALLLDKGGWFSEAKIVMMEDVNTIGKDAVIIDSESRVKMASEVTSQVIGVSKEYKNLIKTKIISDQGTDLGKVSDIYFDSQTGMVSELEISQGLMNLRSGSKRIKVEDIVETGEEVTIVASRAERDMEMQAEEQGLQGAVNDASEKVRENAPEVADRAKTTAKQVKETIQEEVEKMKKDTADY